MLRGDVLVADEIDPDSALAVAARDDREAFLQLYDRFVPHIERYVAARIGSGDVDDIVSGTFLRAIEHIGGFNPRRGSFAPWLFAIARNEIRTHYRRQSRTETLGDRDWQSDDIGPDAVAERNEEMRRVMVAVSRLTGEQRDALALRFAAGLPFRDVGKVLGKSEGAAKMAVQRAIRALRAELERGRYEGGR